MLEVLFIKYAFQDEGLHLPNGVKYAITAQQFGEMLTCIYLNDAYKSARRLHPTRTIWNKEPMTKQEKVTRADLENKESVREEKTSKEDEVERTKAKKEAEYRKIQEQKDTEVQTTKEKNEAEFLKAAENNEAKYNDAVEKRAGKKTVIKKTSQIEPENMIVEEIPATAEKDLLGKREPEITGFLGNPSPEKEKHVHIEEPKIEKPVATEPEEAESEMIQVMYNIRQEYHSLGS